MRKFLPHPHSGNTTFFYFRLIFKYFDTFLNDLCSFFLIIAHRVSRSEENLWRWASIEKWQTGWSFNKSSNYFLLHFSCTYGHFSNSSVMRIALWNNSEFWFYRIPFLQLSLQIEGYLKREKVNGEFHFIVLPMLIQYCHRKRSWFFHRRSILANS